MPPVPELLAPAGSLDAVRAAVANRADAVYLGAARFNARDEGAQLSLDELADAVRIAHAGGTRVYLTLNVLIKPAELADALLFLGEAVDRGIDAVIVQDLGLVRLIQQVYPALEIHGSTQMTVHDVAGAAVMRDIGIERVVLARENSLADLRAIHAAVPDIGLETFVHGALCISYSGQCYMSGMISERSANRGSCAQSCRKDYFLNDVSTGAELDRGYLISARDLGAHDHLAEIAAAGVGCLKIEGRKKKPEYVATVTHAYREWLDRLARGEPTPGAVAAPLVQAEEVEPLVQIYSRGFTGGMYGGRAGREYITRDQPDNRGVEMGVVVGFERGELLVEVTRALEVGDGVGFVAPDAQGGPTTGFSIERIRTVASRGTLRQAIVARTRVPNGWRVYRTAHASLIERARASFQHAPVPKLGGKVRLDVRLFGAAGTPLKAVFTAGPLSATAVTDATLSPAARRPLDYSALREQLGRLGDTPFTLGTLDIAGMSEGLFLPVSALNHLRQQATEELMNVRKWEDDARLAERDTVVRTAVASVTTDQPRAVASDATAPALAALVYTIEDALAAAGAGATEVVFDPFLRHPAPPRTRITALAAQLAEQGIGFRLRTPTIVRPEDRKLVDRWLALDVPMLTGHLGLLAELAATGRDVVGDYALNVFNPHTAAEMFRLGARRLVMSVELTAREMIELAAPWDGAGFETLVYGRPEGMTLEHCVLSAAFDREVTTCRDLCVQKHPNVELTDPAGYAFPVATDYACRNRLLHSRPVDGSEFLPELWRGGIRRYQLVFNVPGDPVAGVVGAYRRMIDDLAAERRPDATEVRELVGGVFTRGHFARAV